MYLKKTVNYYIIQSMNIYFDNAATTMVCEEAATAALDMMRDIYGNPSSSHHMGRAAAKELNNARKIIADAVGAPDNEIYFTSGGTESVNWAVLCGVPAHFRKGNHIITSAIEHSAVLESMKQHEKAGWEVTYLHPDDNGRITANDFAAALRENTVFASIMLVNNETGAVNPIHEFSKEIKKRKLGTILHTDAVQGFGKIPFTVKSLGVELLSVSAHKLHGPKGAGALYIKNNTGIHSLLFGGEQEEKKRPGTEALPAIAGFGAATKIAIQKQEEALAAVRELREYIVRELKSRLPGIVIIGNGDSPYLLNISLPGYKSEVIMNFLDNEGICVTSGSACRKGKRSRVLEVMKLKNDIIDGAIRISFSRYSLKKEADIFINTLEKAYNNIIRF